MIKNILIVITLIFLECSSFLTNQKGGRNTDIDTFGINQFTIKVQFYDPLKFINKKFPDFDLNNNSISEQDKAKQWDEYLHNSAIYLFTAYDSSGNIIKYFSIKGNPNIQNTASFYKIEVISNKVPLPFDPNHNTYDKYIEKIVTSNGIRGSLFENMGAFQQPENQKYIGTGIKFLGYYYRVTPYLEIKNKINEIIVSELIK
jgi:hypothetical protein